MENADNIILEKTFNFSIQSIKYAEKLEKNKKFIITNQLLKSATSIGANIWEAQKAESNLDFIHKLKISDKEASETEYWLKLCENLEGYPPVDSLIGDLFEIQKILNKIIASSKLKLKNK